MKLNAHRSLAIALTVCSIGGMSACGGGNHGNAGAGSQAAGEVVVNVDGTAITRGQIGHWMQTLAGRGYYTASHHLKAPQGLVSDPPDYGRCVERIEAAADHGSSGHARESGAKLLAKCHQLYQAVRIQATTFLIGAERAIAIARELGITVSDGAVERSYKQSTDRVYPTEASYRDYLANTGESVADALLEAKLDLIGDAVLKKAATPTGRVQFGLAEQRLASKISCKPGYVVEYCRGYKSTKQYPTTPPPSVLMEQVATLVTGHCVNLAACREQQIGK
jgi:hypothetical protein